VELERARRTFDQLLELVAENMPPGTEVRPVWSGFLREMRDYFEPHIATSPGADPHRRHIYAIAHAALAQIVFLREGVEADARARAHYDEALAALESLGDDAPSAAADLAWIASRRAKHLAAVGDPEVEAGFEKARDAWRQAGEASPEQPETLLGLTRVLADRGSHLASLGRWDEAIETNLEALGILRGLEKTHPGEPDCLEELGDCFFRLGVLLARVGNQKKADEAHIKAFRRRLELHDHYPDNEGHERAFLQSYLEIGPVMARKRGVHGPPLPFEPQVEPDATVPELALTSASVPLTIQLPIAVAGAQPIPAEDPRFWVVTHRGAGRTSVGDIQADILTVWSSGADFVMFCYLYDARGDRFQVTCNGSYSGKRQWTGTYLITGGTGRFAEVAGSGQAMLQEPNPTLHLTGGLARR
jgi:tetratricopeptide (TPR) repeat protein